MQHFTQKWCLVSLLEPAQEGAVFHWKDWYLHTTIAGVFSADIRQSQLTDKLSTLLANQKPIITTIVENVSFGPPEKPFLVSLLDNTYELQQLHNKIVSLLTNNGAVFNEPKYINAGYKPHVTVQKKSRVYAGETIVIDNLALIDMFAEKDGYKRKIYKTFKFRT
jgi:2'-5' RNA ligase